jgi:4-aminobutyrate aminotransferase-like enzyme
MNQGITIMLDKTQRVAIDAPALAGGIKKPDLITVEQAKAMSLADMTTFFKEHLNPGQLHFMKLLGFNKMKVDRAEGMYYIDQNGRKILDFFGGFGSLAFGHNHPPESFGA